VVSREALRTQAGDDAVSKNVTMRICILAKDAACYLKKVAADEIFEQSAGRRSNLAAGGNRTDQSRRQGAVTGGGIRTAAAPRWRVSMLRDRICFQGLKAPGYFPSPRRGDE
jgi:hypothetical protein